jgi:cytochrome c-type biogenesis protein CcmH/NrfF
MPRFRNATFGPALLRALALLLAVGVAPMFVSGGDLAAQSQYELPRGDGEPYRAHPEAVEAVNKLKSPYCPTMLEVCPSPAGAALRDSIADLAEQGWESDRIVEWVIDRHGEEYRAVPPRTAGGFVAWWMPAFGAVMLLLGTIAVLQRMRSDPEARPARVHHVSEDDHARLREAMREIDAEEEATFF